MKPPIKLSFLIQLTASWLSRDGCLGTPVWLACPALTSPSMLGDEDSRERRRFVPCGGLLVVGGPMWGSCAVEGACWWCGACGGRPAGVDVCG